MRLIEIYVFNSFNYLLRLVRPSGSISVSAHNYPIMRLEDIVDIRVMCGVSNLYSNLPSERVACVL